MTQQSMSCPCGNITVAGQLLQPGSIPNIPGSERHRASSLTSCALITRNSITVANPASFSVQPHTPICTDIICGRCRGTFRFFLARPYSFIGRIPDTDPPQSRAPIPPSLRPMLSLPPPPPPQETDEIETDADFDIMFANRGLPVVGSYKHRVGFTDGDIVSPTADELPKSYYA